MVPGNGHLFWNEYKWLKKINLHGLITLCLFFGCLFFAPGSLKKASSPSSVTDHLLFNYWLLRGAPLWSSLATVNGFGRRIKIWTWAKHWDSSKEKKPTIVDNTNKKWSSRKRSRKQPTVSFMDTFQDEAEDQVEKKRTRSDFFTQYGALSFWLFLYVPWPGTGTEEGLNNLAICIRKFLVHFEFKVRINVVGRAKTCKNGFEKANFKP